MSLEQPIQNKNGPNASSENGNESSKLKIRFRVREPQLIVTQSAHVLPSPKFSSLSEYLNEFIYLDDGEHSKEQALESCKQQVALRRRINTLKSLGCFAKTQGLEHKKQPNPYKEPVFHDHLVSHAVHLAKIMHTKRHQHLSRAKKVSGLITAYFKKLSGADEKRIRDEEKRLKLLAKRTAWEIRKKWKVIEREVKRRQTERAEEAMRIAGKEHIAHIIEHSTQLLEARLEKKRPSSTHSIKSTETDEVDWDFLGKTPDNELSVEQLRLKYSNPNRIQFDNEDSEDTSDTYDDSDMSEEVVEDEEGTLDQGSTQYDSEDEGLTGSEDENDASDSLLALFSFEERSQMSSRTEEKDNAMTKEHEDAGVLVSKKETKIKQEPVEQQFAPMKRRLRSYTPVSPENEPTKRLKPSSVEEESKPAPQNEQENDSVDETVVIPRTFEHVNVPFLFRGQLREYQHYGLEWLAALHESRTNGILADEMGLGKTIQTIALLAYLACEKENWGPHLIIVPTSVMLNWEMEFKKFLPGFKILTYYGNPQERKEKRKGWYKPDTWHVCITSYQLVLQDHQPFRRKKWQYMILDEAHNIKNFRSQRWQALLNFNAEYRLLLTGTPLQNNLMELWSLMYFLMPAGVANSGVSFANLKDFQDWFSKPMDKIIEEGDQMDSEALMTVAKLHRILRPYLLRRLKSEVEKQMPGKYEHVIPCQLSKRQRFLYDDFITRAQTREILASGNFMSIINCLMQLRKVCNHPNLFEERPIVTSFAIRREAVVDMEIKDFLVRKRLLETDPGMTLDCSTLRLVRTDSEQFDSYVADDLYDLCANEGFNKQMTLLEMQIDNSTTLNYSSRATFSEYYANCRLREKLEKTKHKDYINRLRCDRRPIFGHKFLQLLTSLPKKCNAMEYNAKAVNHADYHLRSTNALRQCVLSLSDRAESMRSVFQLFACITPNVVVVDLPQLVCSPLRTYITPELILNNTPWHQICTRLAIAFPDRRLLQYDCGKLQKLDLLLREIVPAGHRVLIFTQMTRVLDILEQFLNIHGYRYLRLDGATKVEQRQLLTERFNQDERIPVFILSTRSGGLGINLTGADTVIFYDSDWNPQLDAQAQDRSHRIGQTRDVHIYRLISEYTVESNMLKRANQKRMLDKIVIQGGEFNTEWFKKADVLDLFDVETKPTANIQEGHDEESNWEAALAAAEDEEDVKAAQAAQHENALERNEFYDIPSAKGTASTPGSTISNDQSEGTESVADELNEDNEEEDDTVGHIDEYMILFLEREGTSDTW
ncbi:SNF2 family helicase Swr1 [Schizosaccharomyces japonicus yFS275]|uniref:DNA helicase n=1 Tax=Schizosaccharomyces japonicus (strain yFS275 / FY16936) TaxID=402676 RepID=B6K0L5_SCHJY|nr:SNF2 family helicase Swr1 [Schizosaccharomyces japonicus yFS275]EEB07486.1 SNF2 family helicase Swr1 [Schizosaccharomyces japonicus yFS275]